MTPEEIESAKSCWEELKNMLIEQGQEPLINTMEQMVGIVGVDAIFVIIDNQDQFKILPSEAKDKFKRGLKYLEHKSKTQQ